MITAEGKGREMTTTHLYNSTGSEELPRIHHPEQEETMPFVEEVSIYIPFLCIRRVHLVRAMFWVVNALCTSAWSLPCFSGW